MDPGSGLRSRNLSFAAEEEITGPENIETGINNTGRKMAYKKLLLDVDGTLLDFDASAARSLEILFESRNYPYNEAVFPLYEKINQSLWERYERGELARERVLVDRFYQLFAELGIDEPGETFENDFRDALENNPIWMNGAEEILQYLFPKYEMYIVTNGVASTQRKRLAATGLDQYVKEVFISELIGAQKPQKAFFDHCIGHIGPCDLREILLIGDSLSADIRGANMAGIPSCWFNPHEKPLSGDVKPDLVIRSLDELRSIL